jgi:hypothetical protein
MAIRYELRGVASKEQPEIEKPVFWTQSSSPLISSSGIKRSILRLHTSLKVTDGISAAVVYEQHIPSSSSADPTPAATSSEPPAEKPLKRTGRLLLSFIVCPTNPKLDYAEPLDRLLVFDIPITDMGLLAEFPGIVELPLPPEKPETQGKPPADPEERPGFWMEMLLESIENKKEEKKREKKREEALRMRLIKVDALGRQMYAGIVLLDRTYAAGAPFVWPSATGDATIYFRGREDFFMALNYDMTSLRSSVIVPTGSSQPEKQPLLLMPRGRASSSIKVTSQACLWAPTEVAINLTISAKQENGVESKEEWLGVPSAADVSIV